MKEFSANGEKIIVCSENHSGDVRYHIFWKNTHTQIYIYIYIYIHVQCVCICIKKYTVRWRITEKVFAVLIYVTTAVERVTPDTLTRAWF